MDWRGSASMSLTLILVYNQPSTNFRTVDSFEARETCQDYGQIKCWVCRSRPRPSVSW
jgi:hypothetical protein